MNCIHCKKKVTKTEIDLRESKICIYCLSKIFGGSTYKRKKTSITLEEAELWFGFLNEINKNK